MNPGRLFVVATPIGNPADITLRALETLRFVPLIACEDTRSAGLLLARLGIPPPRLVSLFEHNEERRIPPILSHLASGADAALISEAGTPTLSDPGFRLVSRCAAEAIPVIPIPGPCAAVAALSASGLPSDSFLFLGFPPKKGTKLTRFLDRLTEPGRTAIAYVPARRLSDLLASIRERSSTARIAVARELTKTWEEILRGTPDELAAHFERHDPKGECTLLVYVPD